MNNQQSNSETLNTTVYEEFSIKLESTPSTGYIWEISELPGGIKLLGSFVENDGGISQAGGITMQEFRFCTVMPGEFTLFIVLKRPWESNASQTKTYIVKAKPVNN